MNSNQALKILNLRPGVCLEDAKQMYRNLAKQYHPDIIAQDSNTQKAGEARMKEINLAYKTLSPHLKKKSQTDTKIAETDCKTTSTPNEDAIRKTNSDPAKKTKEFSWANIIRQFGKAFINKTDSDQANASFKAKPSRSKNRKPEPKTSLKFDEIFKKAYPVKPSYGQAKTNKNRPVRSNPYSGYQKFMALKKKANAMQSSKSSDMSVGKIQKISPVKPVTRVK